MKVFTDSLSFGMRDAIDQGCENEVIILTACSFSNEAELQQVLEQYDSSYWQEHPTAAEAVRLAYTEGRIIIPQLVGLCCPIGRPRRRLYANWEEWRVELSRHAPDWRWGWCPRNCEVTAEQVLACESVMDVCKLFPKLKW